MVFVNLEEEVKKFSKDISEIIEEKSKEILEEDQYQKVANDNLASKFLSNISDIVQKIQSIKVNLAKYGQIRLLKKNL